MRQPNDVVEIPFEFIELASHWYNGQDDMLYALSSTGNISMGNRRPYDCDTDTDWIVRLWESLACDIRAAMRAIRKINSAQDDDDLATFERFEKFAEGIADSFVA